MKIDLSQAVAVCVLIAGGLFLLNSHGCEALPWLPSDGTSDEAVDDAVNDPPPNDTFGFETTLPPKFSNRKEAMEASGRLDGLATVISANHDDKVNTMATVLLLAKSVGGPVNLSDEVGVVLHRKIGVDPEITAAKRRQIVAIFRAAAWVLRNVE